MLISLASIFLSSIIAGIFFDRYEKFLQVLIASLIAGLLVYFSTYAPQIIAGDTVYQSQQWIPSLNVHLHFNLDGLSFLFVLLILGVGLLVLLYAFRYMKDYEQKGRFFAFFLFFMGAMLGLVLAANLISLFVFWELTSLSSFLLIGFNNDKRTSRKAARQALLITAGGGLALLAGFVLLSMLAGGSFDLLAIAALENLPEEGGLLSAAIVLIVIGAATKSAQFPFHFWLPNAMAAPTPVSAYLHSATMVKAGVYLILRLNPLFADIPLWTDLLGILGAITMTYGAFRSLQEDDLKLILAYTTISALGIFFMMVGVGGEPAINAVLVYLLAHALYKSTLFLSAGNIDHQTGTRQLSKLANLRKVMPYTSAAVSLSLASMAGVIPFIGFVGKEALYESLYHSESIFATTCLALLFVSGAFFMAVAIDIVVNTLIAKKKDDNSSVKEANVWMIAAPITTASVGLALGIVPGIGLEPWLQWSAATALGHEPSMHLKLWHGFNEVFVLSLVTLVAGWGVYTQLGLIRKIKRPPWLQSVFYYRHFIEGIGQLSKSTTTVLQNGLLRNYIASMVLTFCVLAIYVLYTGQLLIWPQRSLLLEDISIYEAVIILLVLIATAFLFKTRSKLIVTATFGIIGYSIALAYVLFSAPDVAITQFLAETLSLILLIIILHRLPSYTLGRRIPNRQYLPVAILFGLTMSFISFSMLNAPKATNLKDSVLSQSVEKGKGENAVNVILVDFRALDTLGEIIVLAVTMVGIIGLLRFKLDSSDL